MVIITVMTTAIITHSNLSLRAVFRLVPGYCLFASTSIANYFSLALIEGAMLGSFRRWLVSAGTDLPPSFLFDHLFPASAGTDPASPLFDQLSPG